MPCARFTSERGRIAAFTVQFDVRLGGRRRPVVRFDTAHGRVHRDLLDAEGELVAKDWDWIGADLSYNEAMTAAQREIRAQWPASRASFLRR